MFSVNSAIIARPSPIGYAPIIACGALIGGEADNLDGLAVERLPFGYILGVEINDALGWWKYRARADGEMEDQVAFVEPDTNPNDGIWVKIL